MKSILTVIDGAHSQDLTTLETAKAELGITDDSKNELIRRLIREASGAIASYCKRVFGKETVQEVFRLHTHWDYWTSYPSVPEQVKKLAFARYPIVSITSILEADTVLASTDYEFDGETGLVTRLVNDCPRSWEHRKITVTYVGGYALLDSLPSPLERAALILLTHYYSQRGRDPFLKRTRVEGIGEREYWVGSIGQNGALPPGVIDLISPYSNTNVG